MKRGLSIAIAVMFAISFQTGDVWSAVTVGQDVFRSVKKELIAVKIEEPPAIDGTLNDVCWKNAPKAVGFTDERTEKPAKNQSVAQLVYTDTALYVAFYLYDDQVDKIVARQTKDQTRFRGEDWVSFTIDPFHTHQYSDRNFFMANPLGTKFAHLATGRAEKSEWIGLWQVAAQIASQYLRSSRSMSLNGHWGLWE
jgi:hypothetical protein